MDVKAQRDRFLAFSFASADLLIETDAAGRVVFAIGATLPIGAGSPDEIEGAQLEALFEDAERGLIEHLVTSLRPGRRIGPAMLRPRGSAAPVSLSACTLPGADDRRFFAITYAASVAPAAAAAPRDRATGLVTADAFESVAADTVKRLKESGRDARLTLLDLGGQDGLLARLEDKTGEEFLGRVGAIVRASAIGDAASQLSAGRYGLIHDAATDANRMKDDIAAVARDVDPSGEGLVVAERTITVDSSLSSDDTARALVYTISSFAGGDGDTANFATMNDAFDGMMRATSARMAEFKSAISQKRISFVAQPVVVLKTREISHYELLVRFDGDKSPFEMVSFAEKTGIIAELDISVVEAASAFLARSENAAVPGLAVNMSGLSIVNPMFQSRLFRHLLKVPFARAKLLFEITESAEISDLAAADAAIRKLRKLGHHVCLDDFGSGAASFPYLRALDVDGVKIDGGYVRKALEVRRDAMLLKAMAALCRDLNVTTIAEMVETEDHVTHLLKLGVDKGQGWLFGRPAPLAKLARASAA